MTVILSGDRLVIEFRDSGVVQDFDLRTGQVDWDFSAVRSLNIQVVVGLSSRKLVEAIAQVKGELRRS